MGEMLEFQRPDGRLVPGYVTFGGTTASAPGIVLIQEWWGLNEQIKHTADRLSSAGFRVVVPDLYRGRLAKDGDEANHLMTHLDWGGAVKDIAGAVHYLRAFGGKVGVVGFCMGGALTILASVHVPGIDAAVCFYGIPPEDAADPARIRIPFQGHFAKQDDWCTPERVDALEDRLREGGVSYNVFRYDAQHAFFNENRPEVHDPDASNLAWSRALTFLEEQLIR